MEAVRMVVAGMWMQDPGSLSSGNSRWLMIFVGMVAVAMVVQAIVVIFAAVGAAKASKKGLEIAEELREKMMPLITSTHDIVRDSGPKVKVITENLMETSHVVRSKAAEFDATASELNAKARAQAARVDGMVTGVLNTTTEISETLQRAIKVPVKEFSGLVNGFKAGLDVLVGRAREFGRGRPVAPPHNRDTEW
jgi:hypothetical protein